MPACNAYDACVRRPSSGSVRHAAYAMYLVPMSSHTAAHSLDLVHHGSPSSASDAASAASGHTPLLDGVRVVLFAVNVPGPVAAARLASMGAGITKIEPPGGDPLERYCPNWYRSLCRTASVRRLDLRDAEARAELHALLHDADLLLTSYRPSSLTRLGLDKASLERAHPSLAVVSIVGHPGRHSDIAGHDLTYQAREGLLSPPAMPRSLLADLSGAERAVSTSLALLLARARSVAEGTAGSQASARTSWYREIALSDAVGDLGAPWRFGLTSANGLLGGTYPMYRLYAARDGWIAVAALEPQFAERLAAELGVTEATHEALERVFSQDTADSWEVWAAARDLPIAAVREQPR
jgi:alpha-methylacyl-CoA racemase